MTHLMLCLVCSMCCVCSMCYVSCAGSRGKRLMQQPTGRWCKCISIRYAKLCFDNRKRILARCFWRLHANIPTTIITAVIDNIFLQSLLLPLPQLFAITSSSYGNKTHKANSEVGTINCTKHLLCCSQQV